MIVDCHICKIKIEGTEISNYILEDSFDPINKLKYTFLKCPKCEKPILVVQRLEFDFMQFTYGDPNQLYPNDDFYVNPTIPENLRNALLESIQCYKSGADTATVIMCRRTIEGFCSIKKINERTLAKSIEKLKDNGIINEQLFEWANELRISGNEAAHNIEATFSSVDSKDILDFTIAILDFSYSFKEKFENFKKRRNAVANQIQRQK